MRLACGSQANLELERLVYAAGIPLSHRQVSPTYDTLYPRHSSSQRISAGMSRRRPWHGRRNIVALATVIVGNLSANAVLISPASPSLTYNYNSHTESHLSISGAAWGAEN